MPDDRTGKLGQASAATAQAHGVTTILQHSPARHQIGQTLDEYAGLVENREAGARARYATVVNHFYDLVTDFYEYGWGPSFHFATRFTGETFREAIARFEHRIALKLGLGPGFRVLDIGCGVGGPMRTIARFSGASVIGINNNDYQIARANAYNRAAGLAHLCTAQKGDFMALTLAPDSVDAAYAIEATCHAPSLAGVYAQVWRALKPGGLFACCEWCMTARFDENDRDHRRLRDAVCVGNGLFGLPTTDEALAAARSAGFDILDATDLSLTGDIPWYEPLAPSGFSLASFRSSPPGRVCTNGLVGVLETLRIAPRGSRAVSQFLNEAADALVEVGRAGIFTPDFLMLMRKPTS